MVNEEKIIISSTDDTPSIIIDGEKLFVRIEGPSFPENAVEFYVPIINILAEKIPTWNGNINVEFEFSILSSASNKVIYEMLAKLEEFIKLGKEISIKWIYESYDEDMLDEGLGYKECLKLPLELIEKESTT
ncbi:MAG: DUF1987 domain-containing protein [Bacteroidales bacterium]|nr:DUF1987 domain-containing protein [Bacteroidales bacterium]